MQHYVLIVVLGIIVAIFPFLGFPPQWDMYITLCLGVVISLIALFNYKRKGIEQFLSIGTDSEKSHNEKWN